MTASKRLLSVCLLLVGMGLPTLSAEAVLSGGIRLRVGGRFLHVAVETTAPVVVYDGVYYRRTVETVSTLSPVVREVPQTVAVAVPAGIREIVVEGATYPLEPAATPRTIEVVTGTIRKTVYEPMQTEATVYVPGDGVVVTGVVYVVPKTVRTSWLRIGGVLAVGEKRHVRFISCTAPGTVVLVDGFWRHRKGTKVVGRPPAPPKAVTPRRADPPHRRRRRWDWW